ncbi:MAG: cell division protein FtsQ/DivIB [Planctomycetota bacterium]
MSTPNASQGQWKTAFAFLLVFVFVGLALRHARNEVDLQRAADAGSWSLTEDSFPDWFPQTLTPALKELQQIPSRIPHDSVHWRDHVRSQLLENPWVHSVGSIERQMGRISFSAVLRRPVVAVRCPGGHLLVTPEGRVIDYEEGYTLDPHWRIPEYSSMGGNANVEANLSTLPAGDEWSQLLTLVGDLFDHGILSDHSGFVEELRWSPQNDGGFWYLICEGGLRLAWGKATGSGSRLPGSVRDKITAMRKVIADKDRLVPLATSIDEISLFAGPNPIVTQR